MFGEAQTYTSNWRNARYIQDVEWPKYYPTSQSVSYNFDTITKIIVNYSDYISILKSLSVEEMLVTH